MKTYNWQVDDSCFTDQSLPSKLKRTYLNALGICIFKNLCIYPINRSKKNPLTTVSHLTGNWKIPQWWPYAGQRWISSRYSYCELSHSPSHLFCSQSSRIFSSSSPDLTPPLRRPKNVKLYFNSDQLCLKTIISLTGHILLFYKTSRELSGDSF